ncbi:hypothetical protein ACTVJH_04295 [Desulfoplanes sp. PS50]|jgi:hypothetical protein
MGLHARVLNCLQTILDLESDLDTAGMGDGLVEEFNELKEIVTKTTAWDLEETDVQRIERATAAFLKELELPLALRRKGGILDRLQ